ncbi:formylglycine-generating enzyme family protein [Ekhidna sp. To15]|uniref:formylglycine-generating enzyme family protein n=1 Tax=Ekhidna sp. To15 TaxID=3395267 RepID=UPI003F520262
MSNLICLFLATLSVISQTPKKKEFELTGGVKITMIWVEPGSFTMGSPEDEAGRNIAREKQHEVIITKGFWLAETEFTQSDWEKIMGTNPSTRKGKSHPVETVSHEDVQKLLRKINNGGNSFRLPTEAEWEYACRAGTTGPYSGDLEKTVWHLGNSGRVSHQVATKDPNPWGFYDMQGNILEWCSDWLQEDNTNEKVDPKGPNIGEYKVQRGGQFTGRTRHTRAADRQRGNPEARDFYVGFRLAKNEID